MINMYHFKLKKDGSPRKVTFCRYPELIENYEKAIVDKEIMWECHHRKEEFYSCKELKEMGEYYDISPEDLIFLIPKEHDRIECSVKRRSNAMKTEEVRKKISEGVLRNYAKNGTKKSAYFKVRWVEGDRIFDSSKDAARFFDCSLGAICHVLNGRTPTIRGNHIEKVY